MASKQIDFIAAGLVDSSGNPLQSGTVELYEAGTSTPVTGYADAALGSSLGSTITLDSRGAKLIFVDGLVDLKIIVKDSAGTTINTYDGLDYDASGPTVIDSDPEIVLQNTDQEDTDGGRQSIIRHKGEQSGGEVSTLATLVASHKGTLDDQKGRYRINVNNGTDNDTPTLIATFDNDEVKLEKGLNVTGNSGFGIDSASSYGNVHVRSGASGASSVSASADELVIEGSGGSGLTILSGNVNSGHVMFGDSGDNDIGIIRYDHNLNLMDFTINTSTVLTIDSAQRIGINQTSPSAALDVVGDAEINGNSTITGTSTTTGSAGFGLAGSSAFGNMHIRSGVSNAVSVNASADEVIVEGSGGSGITILSGNINSGHVMFGDDGDSDIGIIRYNHNDNSMDFTTNASLAVTIDSSGNMGIGQSSPSEKLDVVGNAEINGDIIVTGNMGIGQSSPSEKLDVVGNAEINGNIIVTGTVDGVDIATDVVVRDGSIPFTGAVSIQQSNPGAFTPDASTDDLVISASGNCGINIVSSGTSDYAGIRLGDIADPSRALVDYEHANETMRIISDGVVDIQSFFGGTTSNLNMNSGYSLFGNELRVVETSTTTEVFRPRATSTVYTGTVVQALCDTSSSTGFNFFTGVSSAGGAEDTRFLVRGDGNVYNDNNVYSTPADYAEWIESSTGEKIPVGTTVVIESSNGKIRAYNENTDVPEDIVGVIRPGNGSSLEANASTFCWTGKYLKNIYGGYEYDENGDLQLNPDFDENAEYIPRVDRDEYCLMGFIGQIQITKGQTTHPSWRKMRDLSDDVELWIVR